MNYSIIIIGAACLMNLIHRAQIYMTVLQKLKLDRKPFNCIMCSTFWYTLAFAAFTNPVECIFISSTAAIAAELIDIQLSKL